MVNLLPDAEQSEIIARTRALLESELALSRFKQDGSAPTPHHLRLWPLMAQAGWFGIAINDAHGGVGLGLVEEMLVFRELGRVLASPAILATALASRLAATAKPEMAERFIQGQAVVAPVLRHASGPDMVFDGEGCSHLLWWTDDEAALLERPAPGELVEAIGFDDTVQLSRGVVGAVTPLIRTDGSRLPLHRIATVLTSAMLVGMAEALTEAATEHARNRQQFGRPIGEFQAVKHACVDMKMRAEVAFWQTALAAIEQGRASASAGFHVASAKLLAVDAAIKNAAAAIQVHGGMGFTAEAGLHSFLRRAHLLDRLGGGRRHHQRLLLAEPAVEPG